LVNFLALDDHPELQYESCWALTNIASGSTAQTAEVVNAGAVQALIPLMTSPDLEVRGQCVWALANISGDSPECRDFVLRMGAMTPLVAILTAPNPSVRIQRDATWMLSNLCRGKDVPWDIVSAGVPVLSRLLYSADNDVLMDACWALLFITDADTSRASRLLSEGIGPQIVSLLKHPSYAVQMPALRVVGNILFGDEEPTQSLMNLNVLSGLEHLLKCDNKKLRKEACWSLSNIGAGNRTQIQALLDYTSIMEMLFEYAEHADYATKLEAVYVICNAINGGTLDQIRQIVGMGAISILALHLDHEDDKALDVILAAVDHLLDAGIKDIKVPEAYYTELLDEAGGLEKLEDLHSHHSEDIYKTSNTILKKYWPTIDENTSPNINANGTYAWQS
jgi:importin subunit alpha-1